MIRQLQRLNCWDSEKRRRRKERRVFTLLSENENSSGSDCSNSLFVTKEKIYTNCNTEISHLYTIGLNDHLKKQQCCLDNNNNSERTDQVSIITASTSSMSCSYRTINDPAVASPNSVQSFVSKHHLQEQQQNIVTLDDDDIYSVCNSKRRRSMLEKYLKNVDCRKSGPIDMDLFADLLTQFKVTDDNKVETSSDGDKEGRVIIFRSSSDHSFASNHSFVLVDFSSDDDNNDSSSKNSNGYDANDSRSDGDDFYSIIDDDGNDNSGDKIHHGDVLRMDDNEEDDASNCVGADEIDNEELYLSNHENLRMDDNEEDDASNCVGADEKLNLSNHESLLLLIQQTEMLTENNDYDNDNLVVDRKIQNIVVVSPTNVKCQQSVVSTIACTASTISSKVTQTTKFDDNNNEEGENDHHKKEEKCIAQASFVNSFNSSLRSPLVSQKIRRTKFAKNKQKTNIAGISVLAYSAVHYYFLNPESPMSSSPDIFINNVSLIGRAMAASSNVIISKPMEITGAFHCIWIATALMAFQFQYEQNSQKNRTWNTTNTLQHGTAVLTNESYSRIHSAHSFMRHLLMNGA